ncbi:WYL domain-containing protein [Chloracidobacterium validum]|uniref:WYL domain-containing protein n=1 Tax=Chloracidobacterium validum TaxID=2821543 RepID=A0ABX8BEP6_9BACT|nr:WYL domain-containing protein [Chloracidobacterium validum]QUW04139.1 WYL domain-containing protein [Chloracidobacterium validum]
MDIKPRLHFRQLERFTWIHAEIQSGRFPNTCSIAEKFEISRKTAQETIAFMRDRFNLPLAYSGRQRGFYYTEPVHSLPWLTLTEGEVAAILIAERLAQAYAGGLSSDIANVLVKVVQSFTDRVSVDLTHLLNAQSVEPLPTSSINHEHFKALLQAIAQHKRIYMNYFTQSSGETKARKLDPLHLHSARAEWYVIGFDHLRNKVLDFHLGRIREITVLDETFEPPTGFDIERYLARGFGMIRGDGQLYDVVVQFDAYQARWIRQQSKVHKTALYEDLPDGGLRVTMQVGALEGVKQWVMQYGAHVQVVAPPALRDLVRREAEALLAHYSDAAKEAT